MADTDQQTQQPVVQKVPSKIHAAGLAYRKKRAEHRKALIELQRIIALAIQMAAVQDEAPNLKQYSVNSE